MASNNEEIRFIDVYSCREKAAAVEGSQEITYLQAFYVDCDSLAIFCNLCLSNAEFIRDLSASYWKDAVKLMPGGPIRFLRNLELGFTAEKNFAAELTKRLPRRAGLLVNVGAEAEFD